MPAASSANLMHGLNGGAYLSAGGAIIDSAGFDATISQSLTDNGGGGLTKIGSGTLTLSGANSYTGPTLVKAGTLATTTASLRQRRLYRGRRRRPSAWRCSGPMGN